MHEEINGFDIIGSVLNPGDDFRTIWGEGARGSGEDFRLIYVVATAPTDSSGHWHSGRYFDGPDSRVNRAESRRRFLAEVTDALRDDTRPQY